MNNYVEILRYLRPFAGDAQLHNIHQLLNNLGLIDDTKKKTVVGDLVRMKLITADGGHRGGGISIMHGDGTINHFGGGNWYKEYEAKITLEGLKYLQEEIRMEREGAYNITITGHQNQLVVGSKNVNLNAIPEIDKVVDKIVDVLKLEKDLPAQEDHIITLRQFQQEAKQGSIPESTTRKMIALGSDVSSIAGLVLSLLNLAQS